MSENYRLYVAKMNQLRLARNECHPLGGQLRELFDLVEKLEATWAMEDRVGRKYTVREEQASRAPKFEN